MAAATACHLIKSRLLTAGRKTRSVVLGRFRTERIDLE